MNIIQEIKNKKNKIVSINYYGNDDMSSIITLELLIKNKDEILNYYKNKNKIKELDDYIDFIFLENIIKFKEKENSKKLNYLIDEITYIYNEIKRYVNPFIMEYYLNIYNFCDDNDNDLFIEVDLKIYTSIHIGKNFNQFNDEKLLNYLLENRTYDIIDYFEIWYKFFKKEPEKITILFSKNNLNKIFLSRYEDVFDILTTLYKSKIFIIYVNQIIENIYFKIKEICSPAIKQSEIEIWSNYYVIGSFLNLLKNIKSTYTYEIELLFNSQEKIFENNIIENGQEKIIKMDFTSFIKYFDNKEIYWFNKIILLTHSKDKNEKYTNLFEMAINLKDEPITEIFTKNGFQQNDYFTNWNLEKLSYFLLETKGKIGIIFENKERISEYLSCIYTELNYICKRNSTSMKQESLDIYVDRLGQYIVDLFLTLNNNSKSLKTTRENYIYSFSLFICGLIERILKIIFKYNIKDYYYISDEKITLGVLLKEKNQYTTIIRDMLGIDQLKCLRYYLITTEEDKIGYNIRNDLAHYSGRTINNLTYDLVIELLSLFNCILNSSALFYLEKEKKI